MDNGRVALIGEDNPFGSDPEFALYPFPVGCSGYRLQRILGLPEPEYLGLQRMNLCASQAWSMRDARQRAQLIVADPAASYHVIVMLGRKVADAFGYEKPFFTYDVVSRGAVERRIVSLPHPSGRNAASWTQQAHDRTRQILRELAPEVEWGRA